MYKPKTRVLHEGAAEQHTLAEMRSELADVAKSVPKIEHALEEVAEDNVALTRSIKAIGESQDSLRSAVCRELDMLRADVTGELLSQALKNYCRELAPVLGAIQRMVADADLSDAALTRQHLVGLATTLQASLSRMGIEQIPVAAGQDQFDSRLHDCVRICTASDSPVPGARHGDVVFVQEQGYLVRGKVALPAKVWVLQAPVPNAQEDEARGGTGSCGTTR